MDADYSNGSNGTKQSNFANGSNSTNHNTNKTTNSKIFPPNPTDATDLYILRGYRTVCGTHGVSEGIAFFEVIIQKPPTGHEIVSSLPPHIRLGDKLQNSMKKAYYEQDQ